MLRKVALISLLSSAGFAEATSIYKCVDANGRMAFSQTPCSDSAEHLTINVPNIGTSGSTNARAMLDKVEKANRPAEIDREIKKREEDIKNYQKEMDSELSRLRSRKDHAANNLAGATWEGSISTEMNAVVANGKTKIEDARANIESLKSEKNKLNSQNH